MVVQDEDDSSIFSGLSGHSWLGLDVIDLRYLVDTKVSRALFKLVSVWVTKLEEEAIVMIDIWITTFVKDD